MGTREVDATAVTQDEPVPHEPVPPIDVLIVVALQEEFNAVLDEGGGETTWKEVRDRDGLPYRARGLLNEDGKLLGVAVARTPSMGATAAATRAASLIRDLQPSCIAMCGICAGNRGEVALGDVIVADRVYCFDYGKLVVASDGASQGFLHDIITYNLEPAWQLDAATFGQDLGSVAHLLPRRPRQRDFQRRWLLHAIAAHERGEGHPPVEHSEREAMFPRNTSSRSTSDWNDCITELRNSDLVTLVGSTLNLTETGRGKVEEDRVLYRDGLPTQRPFRVHVGPIATGNAVIEDRQIFDRLKRVERKTLGVEMEAYAIGYVGDGLPRRAIVAKAVSDHGDPDKDDRFREFACHASAAWLLGFLSKHLKPKARAVTASGTESVGDLGPRSPFPDLGLKNDRSNARMVLDTNDPSIVRVTLGEVDRYDLSDLHRRAQRTLGFRIPGVQLAWKRGPDEAPASLHAFLEVRTSTGGYTRAYPAAVIDGPVDRAIIEAFVAHIVTRYRLETPYLEAAVIHVGVVATDAVAEARHRGVRLESMLELQGLLDFRPYVAEQTRLLERDPVYPSRLYVPQRIDVIGRDNRSADDALDMLDRWLGDEGPQLLVVLGDFGSGKTFLLHELALRLGRRDGATVPILVELRKLEKTRSLDALLGQHFIPERGMKRFDYDAFRYMLEEGRVALLFDGFDELALRVTYETATEHLDTVLQAAIGKAKVVITSRTQHFRNDQQVITALGERVKQRGFRMARLFPFDETRIRRFLENRFDDAVVAKDWFELIGEVKDLLGLSHNPRMLSFIADIPEQDLRRAERGGEITSATLYRVILEKWLGHEVQRAGVEAGLPAALRWKAITDLALLLWPRKERSIAIGEIPLTIVNEVARLAERPLGTDSVVHKLGSGTLLSRDEEGRFSFIHQSIVEWLVANTAAEDIRQRRDCALLAVGEMSELMAEFLRALATTNLALAWACQTLSSPTSEIASANANLLLRRFGLTARQISQMGDLEPVEINFDMSRQNLRGRDFSETSHLRGAVLEETDLSEASLVRADLTDTVLTGAQLRRANLEGAILHGADLRSADLSFARLLGADLRNAKLEGAILRYAKLVGAVVDSDALATADTFGAALARPGRFDLEGDLPCIPCSAVAWSADGILLALGYENGMLAFADAGTGRTLRRLEGHPHAVTSLAFSRDGGLLASGSLDQTVRIWNPATGKLLRLLEGHTAGVRSVAFSPDGELFASGSSDKTIRLWRPGTGMHLRTLKGHLGHRYGVTSVAFSPDGDILASGSHDRTIRMWQSETGKLLHYLAGHSAGITSIAFSPAGDVLVSGSHDQTVRLWDLNTHTQLSSLEGHTVGVNTVAFSSDGALVASASASYEPKVRVWSVEDGNQLHALEGHSDGISSIAFSPSGMLLASASHDRTVRLWNPYAGAHIRTIEGHSMDIRSVAFSPNSKSVASGSDDHMVHLWSVTTGVLVHPLVGHTDAVNSIAFSPNGRQLATGSDDRDVLLWNSETGNRVRVLRGHTDGVQCVAFSADGHFASGSYGGAVAVWNLRTETQLWGLKHHSDSVNSIAFSRDGKLLGSAGDDQQVQLWTLADLNSNVATESPLQSIMREMSPRLLAGGRPVTSIAFSPDSQLLASSSDDNTVRLWDPDTGRLIKPLEGHKHPVRSIAFSGDGRLLASGSYKEVRLWRVDTGALVRAFDCHSHWINSVAFSPDSELLATGSTDSTIRLWRVSVALNGGLHPCLATLVPRRDSWMAIAPDGRYKLGGAADDLPEFTIGLCRFEQGELDAYPAAFDQPPQRIANERPLFTLKKR
jgi:WD40 repeat protein/uncharacterized protein YjbI with pentapeptide repeats/nucleoside phosphorylase